MAMPGTSNQLPYLSCCSSNGNARNIQPAFLSVLLFCRGSDDVSTHSLSPCQEGRNKSILIHQRQPPSAVTSSGRPRHPSGRVREGRGRAGRVCVPLCLWRLQASFIQARKVRVRRDEGSDASDAMSEVDWCTQLAAAWGHVASAAGGQLTMQWTEGDRLVLASVPISVTSASPK